VIPQKVLEYLRIPKEHWNASLDQIPEKCPHKKALIGYIDNLVDNIRSPKNLLLSGTYGVGKSAIGSILLKTAAEKRILGCWVTARNLPKYEIEKVMFDENMTMLERLTTAPVIVLDELLLQVGDQRYTEQSAEWLIRARAENCLCTIITTNLTWKAIEERYPALHSVLEARTGGLTVSGHAFRKEIRKQLK